MKTVLAFVLMALVFSMIVGTPMASADAKLDSLVNLATQARSQVKLQLDRTQNVSDETRKLYEQGNQETELLIAAARQGNDEESKQHFLAAMKIFRQITQTFSESAQTMASFKSTPAQAPPVPEFDYRNALYRIENTVNMLKSSAAKNNLPVDFARIDGLLQTAKTSMESGDMATLEKTYGELKTAISEMQKMIRDLITQRSNDRARLFVTSYIAKIDSILAQAKELNLSDEDIAKLTRVKEELASTSDPNQIIIKIKRYSITITPEPANLQEKQARAIQKAVPEETRQEEATKAADTQETRKEDTKNQRIADEIAQLESRMAQIQPHVDESIKPKFARAESLLSKLKNQELTNVADYNKTVKMVDILLDQMERYLKSLQDNKTGETGEQQNQNTESEPKRPPKKDK
jgi:predicted RNase H-like nuclease